MWLATTAGTNLNFTIMTTTQTIANVTVKVTIEDRWPCPEHIKQEFSSLEEAVNDMKRRDVIYKAIRQGDKMVTLQIENTDEAIENWYENEMKITPKHTNPTPDLPTDMYK
jgi:hypothetical protein